MVLIHCGFRISFIIFLSLFKLVGVFLEHGYLLLMLFHPNHLASDVSGGCVNAVVFALGGMSSADP